MRSWSPTRSPRIQRRASPHARSNGEADHTNVCGRGGRRAGASRRARRGARPDPRVTCGAGMPYRIAEISASYWHPLLFRSCPPPRLPALWKRAYHKFCDWMGGVVYEDPWLAGAITASPTARIGAAGRPSAGARASQHDDRIRPGGTPIFMAAGCVFARMGHWIGNRRNSVRSAFQFGTRPLLNPREPDFRAWKRRLMTLHEGDVAAQPVQPDRVLLHGGA